MTAPDLTPYRLVHRAMRDAAHRLADAATGLDSDDDRRVEAFTRYWRGYAGELRCHHRIEDDVLFPALVERVPVAAAHVGRSDADHLRLDVLIESVEAEVAAVRLGAPADVLSGYLGALADHIDEHLDLEDQDLLPLFERHFDAEEYRQLEEQAQRTIGLGRQAVFTLPWIAAAMTEEEQATVLATAPLPFRLLHRLARGRFARLEAAALGPVEADRTPLDDRTAVADDAPVITGRHVPADRFELTAVERALLATGPQRLSVGSR